MNASLGRKIARQATGIPIGDALSLSKMNASLLGRRPELRILGDRKDMKPQLFENIDFKSIAKNPDFPIFRKVKEFASGGIYSEHINIDKEKSDYKLVKKIGIEFSKMGENVKTVPRLHYKSEEYNIIYGALIGTKYERKCPDILVGSKFYEVESYKPPFKRDKISGMFSNGLKQSPNIVINNNKGASDRIFKRTIHNRISIGQKINEVWLYEKGKIRMIYKSSRGVKLPPTMCKSAELPSNQKMIDTAKIQ